MFKFRKKKPKIELVLVKDIKSGDQIAYADVGLVEVLEVNSEAEMTNIRMRSSNHPLFINQTGTIRLWNEMQCSIVRA